MKTLILIRHAKSSWNDASLSDLDRPLNDRGKKDAPVIPPRLRKKGFVIHAFLSRPARRALATAEIFAGEFDIKKKKIILVSALYNAQVPAFFKTISSLDEDLDTVAIFSHNPGITDLANQLTHSRIDD